MATTFVSCPHCGTQIHPVASRCKYCRADVSSAPTSAIAVPLMAAHGQSRGAWSAAALGLVGATALAAALWMRLGTSAADASVTIDTPAPPVPAVAAPKTPGKRFSALVGRWQGIGDQPDWAIQWSVDLKLETVGSVGTKVGTVKYGGTIECSGELIRMADDGELLVLHENITVDVKGTCVAEGTIKLLPTGDKLAATWFYADGKQAATGELAR